MVPASKWVLPKEDRRPKMDKNRVVRVYADDFSEGTYRIKTPGIYTLMEDVELEMNAGDYDEPNAEGKSRILSKSYFLCKMLKMVKCFRVE